MLLFTDKHQKADTGGWRNYLPSPPTVPILLRGGKKGRGRKKESAAERPGPDLTRWGGLRGSGVVGSPRGPQRVNMRDSALKCTLPPTAPFECSDCASAVVVLLKLRDACAPLTLAVALYHTQQ